MQNSYPETSPTLNIGPFIKSNKRNITVFYQNGYWYVHIEFTIQEQ